MIYPKAKIFIVSDTAYCVEFGNEISEELGGKVSSFTKLLDESKAPAIIEIVPSYRSVMVEYDPMIADGEAMSAYLSELSDKVGGSESHSGRTVEIPVCYGGVYGPDLSEVASETGFTEQEVIDIHSGGSYPVYMMGFTPGFPYLGGMDKRIAAPRLKTPRTAILPGTVGIAGEQTGVYPLATPGGWRLIGRTPLKLFDKTNKDPFLLSAGDVVKFVPIDEATYFEMGGEKND